MAIRAQTAKITLSYPDHLLDPSYLLTFIELHGFTDDWKQLGLTDEDLLIVQGFMNANPKGSPVIKGTGGLRKLKFSPLSKSGHKKSFRLGYAYFPEAGVVLLVVAYAKSECDDIPDALKKPIREYLQRQKAVFSKGVVR